MSAGTGGPSPIQPLGPAPSLRAWLAVAVFCAALGCSNSQADRFFPVSGKVSLDGQTLTVGSVSFHPDPSRGNASAHIPIGVIDREGNYELVTIGKKGAPPGWYRVVVFADANALPSGVVPRPLPPKWLMHEKYTDEKTTDLFVEVVEKPDSGTYDLKLSK
jgi:hypothetical protein